MKRPPASDARPVIAARAVRAFGYGLLGVLLGVALSERGLSPVGIGSIITVNAAGHGRRFGPMVVVLAAATAGSAACGAADTSTPMTEQASTASSAPAAAASAAASTVALATPSAAASGDCASPGQAGTDGLTGVGASLTAWNTHHDADPAHPGSYLPAATDAPDRYGNLSCTASGRVVAYVMTFKPPLQSGVVDQTIRAELPGDAARQSTKTGTGCEVRMYSSRRAASALGSDDPGGLVTVVTSSITGSDGSTQVYEIDVSTAAPRQGCA